MSIKEQIAKDFPITEKYVDCAGVTRTFLITVRELPFDSFVVEACEQTKTERGYKFEVLAESAPYIALGRLRDKIRKALSQKYLQIYRGELHMAQNELKGLISHDGLVVDGVLVDWEELKRMLLVTEGFAIHVQISNTSEPQ